MTHLNTRPGLHWSAGFQPAFRMTANAPMAATEAPMVLHVRVVTGAGGGPDKTILRSASHVTPGHLRMAAAYIHPYHDPGFEVIRGHARQFNCPLHEVPEAGAVDPQTIRHLLQICQQQRVTIWHSHDYKSDLLGLVLKRFRPMKLVTTVHGFTRETWRTRLYEHIDNWCFRKYDQVMAVSPQLMEHCAKHGVAKDRLTYVPNGIDPDDFSRKRDTTTARKQLGINPRGIVIGVVGRLSVEKGVDRAIHALAAIRQNHPQVSMHIVGDGPQREKLQALALQLNVMDHVTFHGWQKQSHLFYEAMDMLLLPSHTEGCPNVVLEAMAMNVAVAATDVGNVRELLDDSRCGVVLPEDHTQWPRLMAMLITSDAWRRSITHKARRRVEKQYTFEHRMQRVFDVYSRVLHLPATVARPARRAA